MNKLNKFLRLHENIEIEIKIFSIVISISLLICFVFTVLSFFIFPILNIIFLSQFFLSLFFCWLSFKIHIQKKYKKIYSDLFLLFALIVIDLIFFATQGITGAATLVLALYSSFGILLQNSKKRKYFFIIIQVVNFFVINFIGKKFPELVSPYPNSIESEIDFFVTGLLAILSGAFLIKFFKDSYDLDRKQILQSKEFLQSLYNELEEAKIKTEELSNIKSAFLANMSHEIRTPLNGIIGMTQLYFISNSDKEKETYIKTVESSSKILLSIVNDILDFSKIEAGKINLESSRFCLDTCVLDIIRLFSISPKVLSNLVELSYEIDPTLDKDYIGDAFRLKQILLNLLSNAIKFTEKGYVKLSIIKKKELSGSTEILFKIVDTGIGIEDKSNLFKVFEQADVSITRKFGGTGLGLVISQNLIRLMGGEINVESEFGLGSTFYFTITLKNEMGVKQKATDSNLVWEDLDMRGLSILLVEDNLVNQMIFLKFMEKINLEIDVAANGRIAIEKISSHDYDIVFMDMSMPEMDGLEATRRIRNLNLNKQPKIISLSANVLDDSQEKAYLAGVDEIIAKPYSFVQIKEILVKYNSK